MLRWFVRGVPSVAIAHETRLDRKRVLRALTVVRQAMLRSAPPEFRRVAGTEIAPESRAAQHRRADARESARPPLGLYAAHGRVWAEAVPDAEAEELGRLLRERSRPRSIDLRSLHRYSAVVYRGRLYRLADAGAGRVPFGQIEAFWAYLQRHLRAKGGIRRERLGLYLAEFSWRYNQRKLPPAEQVRALMALIRQSIRWSK